MTTLVGIDTRKGRKGVILASDLCGTSKQWSAQGDVAYRKQKRREIQKIHISDKRDMAIAMSGVVDAYWVGFLTKMKKGKINLQKAIEKEFLAELKELNLDRWDYTSPNIEQMNEMLIATRFNNEPALYDCQPLGKIVRRAWCSIGSGSEYVTDFLTERAADIPYYTNKSRGIDLAVDSLDRAYQDIYTGGLDIVVVEEKRIQSYGKIISNHLRKAKKGYIKEIKDSLRTKSRK